MFRNIIFSTVLLVLFGWALSSMYYAQIQFAEIVKTNPETPWFIEINMLPIFVALLVGGGITAFTMSKLKRNRKSWKDVFILPAEFEESDEREKIITAKACRASYVTMWFAFPIITGLLLIYPFISESVPYYPIIVILILPFVQMIAYFVSWKKNY